MQYMGIARILGGGVGVLVEISITYLVFILFGGSEILYQILIFL